MKNNLKLILCIYVLMLNMMLCGCSTTGKNNNETITIDYNFNSSSEGFINNYTDIPNVTDKSIYNFEYKHEDIPSSNTKGLKLKFNNANEDVFSCVFKELNENNDLEQNTTYNATLSFDLATNVKDENSFVKAGVVSKLPLPEETGEYISLNLDKGDGEKEGKDLKNLGSLKETNKTKEKHELQHYETTMEVTTNRAGMAYIIIGIDSKYNGEVEYYVDNVNLKLEKVFENKESN